MASAAPGDSLVRWLVGGLLTGGVVLGLLVGAYEIGYGRGQSHARSAAPSAAAATTTAGTTTTASGGGPAAQGKRLFAADGCSSCHSVDGTAGVGPTLKGLAGSSVLLADGSTVTADAAYLRRSITDPDAQIVKGYQKGIMSAAVSSLGLTSGDVDALVAFIETR